MLSFDFHLVESPMEQLSYKERAKPSDFLSLDANLKILYNGIVYFDDDIAIIEFWLQLNDWLNKRDNKGFHYHTMEVEDEFNPLISISPIGEYYQIHSPWVEAEIALIDNQTEMVKRLIMLRDDIKEVIERYIQKDISIYESNSIEKVIKRIIEVN